MNKFKCVKDNLLHGFVYLKYYDTDTISFETKNTNSILLGSMKKDVDDLVYEDIEENLEFLYSVKKFQDLL